MNDTKNMFEQLLNADHLKQPFFGNLDAFQKAWQDTLQQSFSKPESTVEELDKRIDELKNVENWLQLNLSMLQNTIQALELQRTNLLSVQEMMQNNEALQAAGQQWWQSIQEQFNHFLQAHQEQMSAVHTQAPATTEATEPTPPPTMPETPVRPPAKRVAKKAINPVSTPKKVVTNKPAAKKVAKKNTPSRTATKPATRLKKG